MKRTILLILTILLSLGTWAQYGGGTYIPNVQNPYAQRDNVVPNGNYNAYVSYSSYTGHTATYELVVRVVNDHVVEIYFPDGGSVHEGYNNSGYIFHGGELSFQRQNGSLIATTRVVCSKDHDRQWQCFDILIE